MYLQLKILVQYWEVLLYYKALMERMAIINLGEVIEILFQEIQRDRLLSLEEWLQKSMLRTTGDLNTSLTSLPFLTASQIPLFTVIIPLILQVNGNTP